MNCMKVKTLKWESGGIGDENEFTDDTTPQLFYRLRYAGAGKRNLYFYHGYINKDDLLFNGTVEECKAFAQTHFENYITNGYLE